LLVERKDGKKMWKKIDEFAAKIGKWLRSEGDAAKIEHAMGSMGSFRTKAWYESHGGAA